MRLAPLRLWQFIDAVNQNKASSGREQIVNPLSRHCCLYIIGNGVNKVLRSRGRLADPMTQRNEEWNKASPCLQRTIERVTSCIYC